MSGMTTIAISAPAVHAEVRPAFTTDLLLNGPQSRAYEALGPKKAVVLPWGRAVGLDWLIRQMWYVHIAQHGAARPFRIAHIVRSRVDFDADHAEAIEQEIAGQWASLGAKIDHASWVIRFPGGSFVKVMPPESRFANGLRVDMITCSDLDRIEPAAFDTIARPLMSHPESWRTLLVGGREHENGTGLLRREMSDPAATVIRANYRDVPEMIGADDLAMIKEQTSPEVFRREWECEIDLTAPAA